MIRDTSAQDRIIQPAPVHRTRRAFLIVAALVAAVLLALSIPALSRWLSAERSISSERLRIATVERGTLVRDVSVQGRVVAAVSPTLYSPVAGTVALIHKAGDTVAKGDLLAEIDSPELKNQLERERASLQQFEVEVRRQRIASDRQKLATRRTADEAEITLSAAEREMQRAENAWAKKAIAEIDYLRTKDTLQNAKIGAKHAAQDARLETQAIQFELETREFELARQRLTAQDLERRVEELKVRSPVDGVVGTVAIADRAVVAANSPLLSVVDLSQLEIAIDVPESYADDLGIGMTAEINYAGTSYPGALASISPEVVNGQVTARVRFAAALPPGLRQNQRVSTRVLMEEKPNVLLVQRGPFVESGNGRYAYVLDGDMAVKRPIELGATSLNAVEIVSGLQAGDRVVISGTDEFAAAGRILVTR